jgi:hypothetical protein
MRFEDLVTAISRKSFFSEIDDNSKLRDPKYFKRIINKWIRKSPA